MSLPLRSILHLLGECRILDGHINLRQNVSISIVTQSAWIQNASLRENIIFGLEYDEVRYKQVIRVCALEVDLQQLKDGDRTDIGEKGVNLSGGQQQRVSLARAAYSRSELIILDDPLSAVDGESTTELFSISVLCFYSALTLLLYVFPSFLFLTIKFEYETTVFSDLQSTCRGSNFP